MRMLGWTVGLLAFLLAADNSSAQGIPGTAGAGEVHTLLQKEPITEKNWPIWRDRLLAWFDQGGPSADPAFRAAERFLHDLADEQSRLPPAYFKDALAWYLLGGSYLGEKPANSDSCRRAEHAYRRSIAIQPTFARGHRGLALALALQIRLREAGPAPKDTRLDEADKELLEAGRLDPKLPIAGIQGMVMLRRGEFDKAASLLETSLRADADNPGLAEELAEALMLDEKGKDRAQRLKPFVERFPENGLLAVRHAYCLALDGRQEEAHAELERARAIGIDPTRALTSEMVAQIEAGKPGGSQVTLSIVLAVALSMGMFVLAMRLLKRDMVKVPAPP